MRSLPDSALNETWLQCLAGDKPARDRIVEHYMSTKLVDKVIRACGLQPSPIADMDDFRSVGTIGLIEAVDRFEIERGWKFETYAVTRIRGALLDEMRSLDWVPRSIRTRVKKVTRTRDKLSVESGVATDEQVAEALKLHVDEVRASKTNIVVPYVTDSAGVNKLRDGTQDLHQSAERTSLAHRAAEVVARMTQQEQALLVSYYVDRRKLRDIGRYFEVPEAKLSKVHSRTLVALQVKLSGVIH